MTRIRETKLALQKRVEYWKSQYDSQCSARSAENRTNEENLRQQQRRTEEAEWMVLRLKAGFNLWKTMNKGTDEENAIATVTWRASDLKEYLQLFS